MLKKPLRAPIDLFPTEEEIAQRAYELCFVVRMPCDNTLGYLHLAEQELLDRGARRALKSAALRRHP